MSEKQVDTEKKYAGGKKPAVIPQIGDYSSRREWKEASWRKLLKSEGLLPILFTSYERDNLVMRAAAFEGLALGKGQRQLSRELSLSLQTINAVKKAMAENTYRSYSERSKKERKKKVYTPSPVSNRRKHRGRAVRTKYGTIRMPH